MSKPGPFPATCQAATQWLATVRACSSWYVLYSCRFVVFSHIPHETGWGGFIASSRPSLAKFPFSHSRSPLLNKQDLEYPYQRPQIFHHQSKSPVDCLRWNPHVSHQDYVASTSHASVLVWRVDNDYRPLMAGLRKHKG